MKEILTKRDILVAQSVYVVKGNDLIQRSRYSLSLMEMKAILFMISKIKPADTEAHEYTFNIKDFCAVCNLAQDTGTYKHYMLNLLDRLGEKVITIELGQGKILKAHWYSSCIVDENIGEIKFVFDKNIAPYLFELKSFYTQYNLEYVLPMKSKYGIRLYEFLKSIKSKHYRQRFSIDEIRERIDCYSYPEYREFRRNVIEPALKEINAYTDLRVKYEAIKQGRFFKFIEFTILKCQDVNETQERLENRREKLGSLT